MFSVTMNIILQRDKNCAISLSYLELRVRVRTKVTILDSFPAFICN